MAGKKTRHLVHGEWMTMNAAAEALGVSRRTLDNWRWQHRRADGGPGLLVDAWDHYSALRSGRIKPGPFKLARRHRVHGRMMTVAEAAEALSVRPKALRQCMYNNGLSLEGAWDRYAARNAERAATARLGLGKRTLYEYRRYHRCSLAAAVAYYEAKRQKRAEAEILRIISDG